MTLMIISIIGIVFVGKGFENKNKSEPIPITQNPVQIIKSNPIQIIKSNDIQIPNYDIKNNEIKVSGSYMNIKTNKYSY
jgi:hypothetical protein